MKARRKKLAVIFAAAVLAFAWAGERDGRTGIRGKTVQAAETGVLEPDREGSVSVVMRDPETEEPVSGGTLTFYRVADAVVKSGEGYVFERTEDFAGSGEALTALDADLAERLAVYARQMGLEGEEKRADASGQILFQDMRPGLFLFIQKEAAAGYYAVSPFLVSIPLEENGICIYEVNATPKMEPLKGLPPVTDGPVTGTPTLPTATPTLPTGTPALPTATPTSPTATPTSPTATPQVISPTLQPGSPGNPVKTGDTAPLLFWSILAAGSLLCIGGYLIIIKRKTHNR